MSVPGTEHHTIVIVGGGTAGITTAARLIRAGQPDVAVIEPSEQHYYQPLFTVVGGGRAPQRATARPEAAVMPKRAHWIRESATAVDPDTQTVTTDAGRVVGYDYLVMAPGIQLDFAQVPGLTETLGRNGVSSNYRYDLTPRTWEFIRDLRGGTALFTMPAGPIKCAGAPQKIAYLAADWWRGQGVLDKIRVILVLPTAAMFSQPDWAGVLTGIAAGYGIEVRKESQLTEVDGDGQAGGHRRHQGGHQGDHRLRSAARRAAAERPGLGRRPARWPTPPSRPGTWPPRSTPWSIPAGRTYIP